MGSPDLRRQEKDQREHGSQRNKRGGGSHAMPRDQLSHDVPHRVVPRHHGQVLAITPDIVAEFRRRPIAPLRFLAQSHEHDIVQVASQLFAETAGRLRRALAAGIFAEGKPVREQLVQQYPQRVKIARGGHRFAGQLLRTRVGGGKLAGDGLSIFDLTQVSWIHQSCDAEIEQFRLPVARHQNVSWLEIAMNHQMLMCVLHGRAELAEQIQPRGERQIVARAIFIERQSFHKLHRQIEAAVRGRSSVQEPGDIGMLQACQYLAFDPEALQNRFTGKLGSYDLQSHASLKLLVGS